MPSATDVAIAAIVASSAVAVITPLATAFIAWRDRRQKVAEGKATRLWDAKREALTATAAFATRLLRQIPASVEAGAPGDLLIAGDLADAEDAKIRANVVAFTHSDVRKAYERLLDGVAAVQPTEAERYAIESVRDQKEQYIEMQLFDQAAEARADELTAIDHSRLKHSYRLDNLTILRDAVTTLLDEVAKDAQR